MIIGDTVYLTKYYYDEAGNRIRKMTYAYLQPITESEPPANSDVSNTSNWALRNDEVYSRDVSGKEVAIYQDNSLLEYPTYGLDVIGKIKDDELHFYLKDHLGSIRATIYDNKLMSAQDYDAWGYILEGRTYESEQGKFKFTGKERDEESFYDYFGARYYDAKVGRWGSEDPLGRKNISQSPYNYVFNNPLLFKDREGRDVVVEVDGTNIKVTIKFYYTKEGERGLSEDKIKLFASYLKEAKYYWNKAGKTVEYKGIDYNVTFDILSEEVKTFENLEEIRKSRDGSNVVKSINEEMWAGVNKNELFLGNSERLVKKQFTGSHEIGHSFGLPHPAGYDDEEVGPLMIDVMSYGDNREPPRVINVRQLIDKINLSDKSKQTINGTP